MKVVVVGQGGREHALVRALNLSSSVSHVFAIPGSRGISQEAECISLPLFPSDQFLNFIKDKKIDLVVVGPEGPLAEGLADELRQRGILTVGPSAQAAQLEASKIFSKEFMKRAGVPSARYEVVRDMEQLEEKAQKFCPPYVLKADGLAAGKGVFICQNWDELREAGHSIFVEKKLGKAGHSALLEEALKGWELSFLVLTNGEELVPLPLSQDHKRLLDGDLGPNTGGMGVVGPLKVSKELIQEIEEKVLKPTVAQLKKEELLYRGVLYVGIMVTEKGPMVLEYNVRFGDPEAQVILPLLDGDWGLIFQAIAQGEIPSLKWKELFCACLVLAAEGYPDQPKANVEIEGDLSPCSSHSYVLHAGTGLSEGGKWVTLGGRVLNAIAWGENLEEAIAFAYKQADQVQWPGRQMRGDIGKKIKI